VFLGLHNTVTEDRIHREWDIATAEDHWLVFARRAPVRSSERKTFKLYVSPRCEKLPSVFAGVAHALFDAGADQFKVGAGTGGLLRPDKIVAYFGTRDDLLAATDPVLRVLGDAPAHGVPFSASLSETGIISWGADPSGDARTRGESWRQWVTTVLASGMVAGALDSVDDMCARALARLQLEGVDPSTYTPTAEWSGWGFQ
jgi:hypothetical protein